MPYFSAVARKASKTPRVVLFSSSGLAQVLTALETASCPFLHSSRSWVEMGTRTMLMPRSAICRVMASRLTDQSPWKTRSVVLNPNQLAPVSQTRLPSSSTIRLPSVCSQSVPVPAAAGEAGAGAAGCAATGPESAVSRAVAVAAAASAVPSLVRVGDFMRRRLSWVKTGRRSWERSHAFLT